MLLGASYAGNLSPLQPQVTRQEVIPGVGGSSRRFMPSGTRPLGYSDFC